MDYNTAVSQVQEKRATKQIIAAVAELERMVQSLKSTGAKRGQPGEMTALDYAEQQLSTAIGIRDFLIEMENQPKS